MPAFVKYGHSSPRLATATPSATVRCSPLAVVMWKVTLYRPSAASGAAVTVTCRLARRFGPSVNAPCAGLTVRPAQGSLTLGPNLRASRQVTVTAAPDAADGRYSVTFHITTASGEQRTVALGVAVAKRGEL